MVVPSYAALISVIVNLAIAAALTLLIRAPGTGQGRDETSSPDYFEREERAAA